MDDADNSLLKNARFRRLWIGQGLSFVGDAVSMVALVLLVVEVSGNASAVGGVLVARLLPTLASPFVGVLADRLDRRAVLVASDLSRAVLVIGLIFARDLPVIYALVFLLGAAQTIFNPTVRAAFPGVVGGGDLTRANALISSTFSFSVMAGPALGGVLVASVGVELAFLLDALSFLASAALLSTIRLPALERDGGEEGYFEELRVGFGYLTSARVPLAIVAGAFLATLTANATIPAEAFLAKDTFGAGDVGYGLLASLWGGGMILGSALAAVLGGRTNLVSLYFVSIFATALALVGVGLSPTFALALGAVAVAGAANGVDNVATDTVLQERVPDAFLGRVFAARFMTFSAGEALAYPLGGLLVDATGPRPTYLLAGAATAVAGLFVVLIVVVPYGSKRPARGNPKGDLRGEPK
ncbi:MAG: MFS transporter [Actinomycetota bacterium]|nr:MFS transporter [Actinomycetota bacterium]